MKSSPTPIYAANSEIEAHCLKLMLENEGIEAAIWGGNLQGARGELPVGSATAPQVVVGADDQERASKLIEQYLQRRKDSAESSEDDEPSEPQDALCSATKVETETPPSQSSVPINDAARRALYWDIVFVVAVAVIPPLHGATEQYLGFLPAWSSARHWGIGLTIHSLTRILALMAYVNRTSQRLADFGLCRMRSFDPVMGLGLAVFYRYFSPLIDGALPISPDTPDSLFPPVKGPLDSTLVIISDLANAFAEEFAMRGLLRTLLLRLWGKPLPAVVVSSACFASYHIYQGLYAVQWVFIDGLFLGGVFMLTRRLWPVVFCHFFFNVVVTFQLL